MIRSRFPAPSVLLAALLLAGGCGEAEEPVQQPAAPPVDMGAVEQPEAAPLQNTSQLGYGLGSPDAPVTVVEFSDFGCPYCGRFALETLPELKREYIEAGQVQWRYVPFSLGTFPNGDQVALAAMCAAEQGGFWPMHDLLYARQREWKTSSAPDELLLGYARTLGLEREEFADCYLQARPAERLAAANRLAQEAGVRATPTFFVNGHRVEGALPLDQFRMMLQWSGAGAE